MSAWWRTYWSDARLAWNATAWDGIDMIVVNSDELWIPDVVMNQAVRVEEEEIVQGNLDVAIYADGSMFFSRSKLSAVRCELNLSNFPFDTQECGFQMASWMSSGYIFDLKPRIVDGEAAAVDLSRFSQNQEFALKRVRTSQYEETYTCCPEPYPAIEVTFSISRATLMYVTGIIFPLILVTVVGFMSFILNPQSGERIGLGITVLLTNAAIYMIAAEMMPQLNIWTAMSRLYATALVFSLATLIVSIVTVSLQYVHKDESEGSYASLLAIFVKHDADKSGYLEESELLSACSELGMHASNFKSLMLLVEKALVDDGKVSWFEWITILEALKSGDSLSAHHNIIVGSIVNCCFVREVKLRTERIKRRTLQTLHVQKMLALKGDAKARGRSVTLSAGQDAGPDAVAVGGVAAEGEGGGERSRRFSDAYVFPTDPNYAQELGALDRVIVSKEDVEDITPQIGRRIAAAIDAVAAIVFPVVFFWTIADILPELGKTFGRDGGEWLAEPTMEHWVL
jgi:hypothetical protein